MVCLAELVWAELVWAELVWAELVWASLTVVAIDRKGNGVVKVASSNSSRISFSSLSLDACLDGNFLLCFF